MLKTLIGLFNKGFVKASLCMLWRFKFIY